MKPRRILKRHSVIDCNNLEVQKFMSKLSNIRRRKRRIDKSNSISPGSTAPIKKSKSYDDIIEQIEECHELCMGSLRAYTPQADKRRRAEAKRSRILRSLFMEKKK